MIQPQRNGDLGGSPSKHTRKGLPIFTATHLGVFLLPFQTNHQLPLSFPWGLRGERRLAAEEGSISSSSSASSPQTGQYRKHSSPTTATSVGRRVDDLDRPSAHNQRNRIAQSHPTRSTLDCRAVRPSGELLFRAQSSAAAAELSGAASKSKAALICLSVPRRCGVFD